MADFEKEEPPRPQYEGAVVRSPVNGREETWFLPRRRRPRLVATGLVTFLMLALVCGFIFLMMIFKHQAGFRRRYGATPAALANALGIQVFHFAYRRIAVKLTSRENWRTETEYADRLTLKLFVFNFVNAYGSLFFTVFIQTHIHIPHEYGESKWDCLDHDCLHDLNYNLYIIFTVSLLAQGFASVVIPLCKRKYHRARETAGESRVAMTKAEWEYLLVEYDETLDTVRNYNTTAVQYGYIALFSVAAPATTLLALANDAMLLRLHGYKYLTNYRRIEPTGAQDIGVFEQVYAFLNVAAALSNVAILVYLPPVYTRANGHSNGNRAAIYMVSVAVVTALLVFGRLVAEEGDPDVDLQLLRQDFIRSKIVDKIADEEETVHVDATPVVEAVAAEDDEPYYASLADAFAPPKAPRDEDAPGWRVATAGAATSGLELDAPPKAPAVAGLQLDAPPRPAPESFAAAAASLKAAPSLADAMDVNFGVESDDDDATCGASCAALR